MQKSYGARINTYKAQVARLLESTTYFIVVVAISLTTDLAGILLVIAIACCDGNSEETHSLRRDRGCRTT